MDATIVFLEHRENRINLLVRFTDHRQLTRQVGDNSAFSFVEKEAPTPRTNGGLAHVMAHDDHICHENYEFTSVRGPAPVSAFSYGLDLRIGDLDPVVYSGHTLKTA